MHRTHEENLKFNKRRRDNSRSQSFEFKNSTTKKGKFCFKRWI